jgi:hypothetical protein
MRLVMKGDADQQQHTQQLSCADDTPSGVTKWEPECKKAFIAFVLQRKYINIFNILVYI